MKESQCRPLVKAREDGCCARCGQYTNTTLHHRKKRGQGGTWDLSNCVMLCGHGTTGCHGWVEHHPNEAEAEGFHVRPWQDPAVITVKYQGQEAYLWEDGTIDYV